MFGVMGQIFHPSANTIAKIAVFGGIFVIIGIFGLWDLYNRSPYVTRVGQPIQQPVPFSHKHHVKDLGLDCRYCHTSVEKSAVAGLPPTKTCMNCHAQIWKDAPMLEPVRESFRSDRSIPWVRVHDLPDFVYFDHSVHVNHGIGCASCHGNVAEMPLMEKANTLHMTWCLQCHRHPDRNIRPQDKVFDVEWKPAPGAPDIGKELVKQYGVESQMDCDACHR